MIKLLKNLRKIDYLWLSISLVLIVGQVLLDLKLPDYIANITTLVSTEGTPMSEIWLAGGKMLACALGSAGMAVIVGYLTANIASNFSYTVRGKVFEKISKFGIIEMKNFSIPSLITRTTNDITQIQMVISMGLQIMIKAPVLAICAIIKIFGKSWELSMVVVCSVIVLIITLLVVMLLVLPKFKKLQKQVDDINRVTEESLTGVKVIRAFNADNYQSNKFEKVNDTLTKTNLFTMRTLSVLSPMLNMIMSGLSLAIYYVGALLINKTAIESKFAVLGDVMAFSSYGVYVVMGFIMLSMIFMILPRAQVSAKRINEVLNTTPSIAEGNLTVTNDQKGTIELKNVSFKFADSQDYILNDVSFKANKGETIAIVGASGCGKTTLVNLIARLYDATEGEVLIDGVNIKDYTFASLYSKVGYIPQKTVMFSSSIKENIAFGETDYPITDEKIKESVEIAQGKEFVESMPKEYNYEIAQGGINISGGQKQRLSIARVIAREPEILIFDDSFSALDFKTDKLLRQQLNEKLTDTTCVIVASRIGTIKNANQIIVLDDGAVAGIGTHESLMNNCEVYKQIALSQLSKMELEN